MRKEEPVSSRVFRPARTAGQPSEIAGRTLLPGAKPSWVTVSLTVPCPTSSMSNATLERGSARQTVRGRLVHADRGGPLGRNGVPRVDQPIVGIGLEDHLFGAAHDEPDFVVVHVVASSPSSSLNGTPWDRPFGAASSAPSTQDR